MKRTVLIRSFFCAKLAVMIASSMFCKKSYNPENRPAFPGRTSFQN